MGNNISCVGKNSEKVDVKEAPIDPIKNAERQTLSGSDYQYKNGDRQENADDTSGMENASMSSHPSTISDRSINTNVDKSGRKVVNSSEDMANRYYRQDTRPDKMEKKVIEGIPVTVVSRERNSYLQSARDDSLSVGNISDDSVQSSASKHRSKVTLTTEIIMRSVPRDKDLSQSMPQLDRPRTGNLESGKRLRTQNHMQTNSLDILTTDEIMPVSELSEIQPPRTQSFESGTNLLGGSNKPGTKDMKKMFPNDSLGDPATLLDNQNEDETSPQDVKPGMSGTIIRGSSDVHNESSIPLLVNGVGGEDMYDVENKVLAGPKSAFASELHSDSLISPDISTSSAAASREPSNSKMSSLVQNSSVTPDSLGQPESAISEASRITISSVAPASAVMPPSAGAQVSSGTTASLETSARMTASTTPTSSSTPASSLASAPCEISALSDTSVKPVSSGMLESAIPTSSKTLASSVIPTSEISTVTPTSSGILTSSVVPFSLGASATSVVPISTGISTSLVVPTSSGKSTSVVSTSSGVSTPSVVSTSSGVSTPSVVPTSSGKLTSVVPTSSGKSTSVVSTSSGVLTPSVVPTSSGKSTLSVVLTSSGKSTSSVMLTSSGKSTSPVPTSSGISTSQVPTSSGISTSLVPTSSGISTSSIVPTSSGISTSSVVPTFSTTSSRIISLVPTSSRISTSLVVPTSSGTFKSSVVPAILETPASFEVPVEPRAQLSTETIASPENEASSSITTAEKLDRSTVTRTKTTSVVSESQEPGVKTADLPSYSKNSRSATTEVAAQPKAIASESASKGPSSYWNGGDDDRAVGAGEGSSPDCDSDVEMSPEIIYQGHGSKVSVPGEQVELLTWAQQVVGHQPGLPCHDLSSCWQDGRLFNTILHRFRPGLVDLEAVHHQSNKQNLQQAFSTAEHHLGIPQLLDPEDVDVNSPDERSIATYLAVLRQAAEGHLPQDGKKLGEGPEDVQSLKKQPPLPSVQDSQRYTHGGVTKEDQACLTFITELQAWVDMNQKEVNATNFGEDLKEVATLVEEQNASHDAIEELRKSLEEAQQCKESLSASCRADYDKRFDVLQRSYNVLVSSSNKRRRQLQELLTFLRAATDKLTWLGSCEDRQVSLDWSDNCPQLNDRQEDYVLLMQEMARQDPAFHGILEQGEELLQEGHPACRLLEGYIDALQTQWSWLLQLDSCTETHLQKNAEYFQFFRDSQSLHQELTSLHDSLVQECSCDCDSDVARLSKALDSIQKKSECLSELHAGVAKLSKKADKVVQLKPRRADYVLESSIPICAICDYKQSNVTLVKNSMYKLEGLHENGKWSIQDSDGRHALVPSVCFIVPPPNVEAGERARRLEEQQLEVKHLFKQRKLDIEAILSWHHLQDTIKSINSWTPCSFQDLSEEVCNGVLDRLENQSSDFKEKIKGSRVFPPEKLWQLEKDASSCKHHYQALLNNLVSEENEEQTYRQLLTELQATGDRLMSLRDEVVQVVKEQSADSSLDNMPSMLTRQERLDQEVDNLGTRLDQIGQQCEPLLNHASRAPSQADLRAELDRCLQIRPHLSDLSTSSLDRLRSLKQVRSIMTGLELHLVKFETSLAEQSSVPTNAQAIEQYQQSVKGMRADLSRHSGTLQRLQDEVSRAHSATEGLSRLEPCAGNLEPVAEAARLLHQRWRDVGSQMDSRLCELDHLSLLLAEYRESYDCVIQWLLGVSAQQDLSQIRQGKSSRELQSHLIQQKALIAKVERTQEEVTRCHELSEKYCNAVKEYEAKLAAYRDLVESITGAVPDHRPTSSALNNIEKEVISLLDRYTSLLNLTKDNAKLLGEALQQAQENETIEAPGTHPCEEIYEVKSVELPSEKNYLESENLKVHENMLKEEKDRLQKIYEDEIVRIKSDLKASVNSELGGKPQKEPEHMLVKEKDPANMYKEAEPGFLQKLEKQEVNTLSSCDPSDQMHNLKAKPVMNNHNDDSVFIESPDLASPSTKDELSTPKPPHLPGFEENKNTSNDLKKHTMRNNFAVIGGDLELKKTMPKLRSPLVGEKVISAMTSSEPGKSVPVPSFSQNIDHKTKDVGLKNFPSDKIYSPVNNVDVIEKSSKTIKNPEIGSPAQDPLTPNGFDEDPRFKSVMFSAPFREVGLDELIELGLVDVNTAKEVVEGHRSVEDVSKAIHTRMWGVGPIAGILHQATEEKLPIFQAKIRGVIGPSVAYDLLEAQLATGFIIDPQNGSRLRLTQAVQEHILDEEMQEKLSKLEMIVRSSFATLPEAARRGEMSNNDALRLTSLQLDTGGIVHPRLGLRIPIQIALVRGLLQKDMAEKLSGSDSTSGFYLDPSTNIRFSYKQLLDKCVIDRETGLLFLPVQARIHERRPSQTSSIRRSRVLIIDPTDNSQLTPYEAYCKEIIDLELYAQLSGKESEWEEVVTTDENGVVKSELFDRETGVRFNVDAALAKGLIDKQKLDHFRSGKMSPTEFVALLSKTSSKPYRLSPGLIPQSPNHNGHSSSSAGGELHSINKTTVAGIMDLQSLEKITISESMKRNLVDTITGQRLLEAQACTGGIISPFTGQRFSLQDAQLQGLIETSVAERITLAQRAYTGYENPKTGIWMSTAEAMCSGRLPYETGQRFLQAQVLTGGLVEPNTPGRVSLDEAERKGSIDARTARKLRDMSTCAQCLTCPKTKLKISLKEAIESSMIDPVTGLSFLEASATSTRGLPSPYSVHDGHSRSTSGRRTHSFSSSSDRQTPSPVRRRPSSPSPRRHRSSSSPRFF